MLIYRCDFRLSSFRLGRLVFLILFQFTSCISFALVDDLSSQRSLDFASPKIAFFLMLPKIIKIHISGLVAAFVAVSFFLRRDNFSLSSDEVFFHPVHNLSLCECCRHNHFGDAISKKQI